MSCSFRALEIDCRTVSFLSRIFLVQSETTTPEARSGDCNPNPIQSFYAQERTRAKNWVVLQSTLETKRVLKKIDLALVT